MVGLDPEICICAKVDDQKWTVKVVFPLTGKPADAAAKFRYKPRDCFSPAVKELEMTADPGSDEKRRDFVRGQLEKDPLFTSDYPYYQRLGYSCYPARRINLGAAAPVAGAADPVV